MPFVHTMFLFVVLSFFGVVLLLVRAFRVLGLRVWEVRALRVLGVERLDF